MALEKSETEQHLSLEENKIINKDIEQIGIDFGTFCGSVAFVGYSISDLAFAIAEWWKAAYPIIEQVANVTGALTGTAAIVSAPFIFIKWARGKLQRTPEINEFAWIQSILWREEWSASSLAYELSISGDDAKQMLKGFGFAWDPKKMMYIATEHTQKLREIR